MSGRVEALERTLAEIAERHSPAALASSLSVEDMVVTDAILRLRLPVGIFTLDTGRLHGDTLRVIDAVRERYGYSIAVYRPDPTSTLEYVSRFGRDAFYESAVLRKRCCEIRKVEPLRRALAGKRAWITGLRCGQSAGRSKAAATGKGNPWLGGTIGEAATGAARTSTFLAGRYKRVVKRRGKKRALVAVGNSILTICWHLLSDPSAHFTDLGPDWHDRLAPQRRKRRDTPSVSQPAGPHRGSDCTRANP